MRGLVLSLAVALLAGCSAKFADADHRFSERLDAPQQGELHARTFNFAAEPAADAITIRVECRFEAWTELILSNEREGRLWNHTLYTEDSWERTGESWTTYREGGDWRGEWSFTVRTAGPARYTFGFYFE